uniref:Uncharacterized protein n=1 Tax=Glossina pallidipes TaxID=7398 RepID=A0A1A9Z0T4_GLOPL
MYKTSTLGSVSIAFVVSYLVVILTMASTEGLCLVCAKNVTICPNGNSTIAANQEISEFRVVQTLLESEMSTCLPPIQQDENDRKAKLAKMENLQNKSFYNFVVIKN